MYYIIGEICFGLLVLYGLIMLVKPTIFVPVHKLDLPEETKRKKLRTARICGSIIMILAVLRYGLLLYSMIRFR